MEENKRLVPSVGRIVHYVLPEGPYKGEHRPAIIVRVWSTQMVQLVLFVDNSNDGYESNTVWKTSVKQDEPDKPEDNCGHALEFGTWHWPETV